MRLLFLVLTLSGCGPVLTTPTAYERETWCLTQQEKDLNQVYASRTWIDLDKQIKCGKKPKKVVHPKAVDYPVAHPEIRLCYRVVDDAGTLEAEECHQLAPQK